MHVSDLFTHPTSEDQLYCAMCTWYMVHRAVPVSIPGTITRRASTTVTRAQNRKKAPYRYIVHASACMVRYMQQPVHHPAPYRKSLGSVNHPVRRTSLRCLPHSCMQTLTGCPRWDLSNHRIRCVVRVAVPPRNLSSAFSPVHAYKCASLRSKQ